MEVWSGTVTDDSGFLALIAPDAYQSFVCLDWEFNQLIERFKQQMKDHHLLIWGTGREDIWKVSVQLDSDLEPDGNRHVTGSIHASAGQLCVTNYEALTMAASYEHIRLPKLPSHGKVFSVPEGMLNCTICQIRDPELEKSESEDVDFLILLSSKPEAISTWTSIPWFTQ